MLFYAKVGAAKDNLNCMQYKYIAVCTFVNLLKKNWHAFLLYTSISSYVVQHLRVNKKLAFNFRE